MSTAQDLDLGRVVRRCVDLGLHDDVLLLAVGLHLETQANPGAGSWKRAAARVHGGLSRRRDVDYWLAQTLRYDLPRHTPAHELPGAPRVPCAQPMVRRPTCGVEVSGDPYGGLFGAFVPVLVGGHVTWQAFCRRHRLVAAPPFNGRPSGSTYRRGQPEAYAAVKLLPHNTGGLLQRAFPQWKIESGYLWADPRWTAVDVGTVHPVRLTLVPPLDPSPEAP